MVSDKENFESLRRREVFPRSQVVSWENLYKTFCWLTLQLMISPWPRSVNVLFIFNPPACEFRLELLPGLKITSMVCQNVFDFTAKLIRRYDKLFKRMSFLERKASLANTLSYTKETSIAHF